MELNKLQQTAGDNSTQVQADLIQITNVLGLDEKRAREICREEYAIAKQNWTEEAVVIADGRVKEFEDRLMPKMIQYDNSLKFFADPAFQFTLRKAQIAAASSERKDDYELLSELLVNRVSQGSNRERRLGIVKAIEVADQIDENALIGLSIVYAVGRYTPVSFSLSEGLNVLDQLYGKILAGHQLPKGTSWIEHLDLLSAVRILDKKLSHFKKFEDYIPGWLSTYVESGIKEDSEEFRTLKGKFEQLELNMSCFVPHPLKKGYLIWTSSRDIEKIAISYNQADDGFPQEHPTDEQRAVIQEALTLACQDGSADQEMMTAFWQVWDSFDNLKTIHLWWNTLEGSFDISQVGVALSSAYIHGKDPTIPCIF